MSLDGTKSVFAKDLGRRGDGLADGLITNSGLYRLVSDLIVEGVVVFGGVSVILVTFAFEASNEAKMLLLCAANQRPASYNY